MPADPPEAQFHHDAQRIGQRIREVREEKTLTQERVFLAVPMNRAHYQDIEAGRANPTLRTLSHIAHVLGVPLSDLVR